MKTYATTQLVLTIVFVVSYTKQLDAIPITFSYSGTVTDVNWDNGTPTEFTVGDEFSGTYTFDSMDTDINSSPNNGYYYGDQEGTLTVGTYSASMPQFSILLVRDNVPVQDYYQVTQSYLDGPDVLGLEFYQFNLNIHDPSGTVFSSDSLSQVLNPPDLADFSGLKQLELTFLDGDTAEFGRVTATLESLELVATLVPEVSTLSLSASAFLALGLFIWRKSRKKRRLL